MYDDFSVALDTCVVRSTQVETLPASKPSTTLIGGFSPMPDMEGVSLFRVGVIAAKFIALHIHLL
ncbi:hypothetical protein GCM10009425_01240 [Pseudomonas asuensis]|uniref:Uncharacterized protein n=1 Tax=Pseudomonas asuensis TaxID=1825787 RepID=A0ABQ2GGF1_9PSED|nr:hypothetical protein GCM10009425_01240 [Pseudomonas asuensis]